MWVKVPIDRGYRPDYLYHEAPQGALRQCTNLLPYDNFYYPAKEAKNYSLSTGIVEAGDSANQLSSWVLNGVTYPMTTNGVLYWTLTLSVPSTKTVSIFKDSSEAFMVASGSRTTDGSITLTEVNNSGISGSVTLAYSAPDTDTASNTLTGMIGLGVPLSGVEFRDSSGVYRTFIGSDDYIFRMNADQTLTDITRSSGGVYTATSTTWDWVQYGDAVVATNYADAPQYISAMSGANFGALGGTPPKAKYIIMNNGHLIFANLVEGSTVYNNKLMWSGLEDIDSTDYSNPTNLATGADYQVLADSNYITGMENVGSGFMVFHPDSVTYGHYVGAPYTFSFVQNKFKGIGAIEGTPISIGDKCFWWDKRDIYMSDGNSYKAIGEGIRETVCQSIKTGYEYRISTYHDPNRHLIYWCYPTSSSTDGTPDKLLVYNYEKDRFTIIDYSVECIFSMHTGALSFDTDETIIDTSSISNIDSPQYDASSEKMGCVTTDGYLASFEGAEMTSTMETYGYGDGNINMLRRLRLNARNVGTSPTAQFGAWFHEYDDPTFTSAYTEGTHCYIDGRATGRYLNVKIQTVEHQGIPLQIDADIVQTGAR